MKFAQVLLHNAVPEWESQYIGYKRLKKKIKAIRMEKSRLDDPVVGHEACLRAAQLEDEFLESVLDEYKFVDEFYTDRLKIVEDRFEQLKDQLRVLEEAVHTRSRSEIARARRLLNRAYFNLYRQCVLLRNYCVLNATGFAKIIKKHDKYCTRALEPVVLRRNEDAEPAFLRRHGLQKLLQEVENIFTTVFYQGDRHAAMQTLRVNEARTTLSVGVRLGLFLGLSLFPLLFILYTLLGRLRGSAALTSTEYLGSMAVYRGLAFLIVFLFLFGINVHVWNRRRINYVFIFELNPRTQRSGLHYWEVAAALLIVWELSLCGYLLGAVYGLPVLGIPNWVFPFSMFLFFLVMLVQPLPILYRSARYWVLRTVARVATAPFHAVYFRDFFVGDQLTSMVPFVIDFVDSVCFFTADAWTGTQRCLEAQLYTRPIAAALPLLFRVLQCFRRVHDTGQELPHVPNAIKYSTAIVAGVINAVAKHYERAPPSTTAYALRTTWIVWSVLTAVYLFYWDTRMDWGWWNLHCRHPLLRAHLMYRHKSVRSLFMHYAAAALRCCFGIVLSRFYYVSFVMDLFLRYAWVLSLTPFQPPIHVDMWLLVVGMIELVRRFFWNFFRLENEHLHNVGHYRVVRDIPLPFPISAGESFAAERAPAERPAEAGQAPAYPTEPKIAAEGEEAYAEQPPQRTPEELGAQDWSREPHEPPHRPEGDGVSESDATEKETPLPPSTGEALKQLRRLSVPDTDQGAEALRPGDRFSVAFFSSTHKAHTLALGADQSESAGLGSTRDAALSSDENDAAPAAAPLTAAPPPASPVAAAPVSATARDEVTVPLVPPGTPRRASFASQASTRSRRSLALQRVPVASDYEEDQETARAHARQHCEPDPTPLPFSREEAEHVRRRAVLAVAHASLATPRGPQPRAPTQPPPPSPQATGSLPSVIPQSPRSQSQVQPQSQQRCRQGAPDTGTPSQRRDDPS